jgi:multimeric flavodoxin WrbA
MAAATDLKNRVKPVQGISFITHTKLCTLMKVIGVVSSPRRNGNTMRLVEEVIRGAKEAGHTTRIFNLADLDIGPLEADDTAYVYPDDGFSELMPHLESMGGLVMGTPIYYDHVSGRLKVFIDRLYYYSRSHGDEYRRRFPSGVKCVNAITCGWDNINAYDEVLKWMNDRMVNYWGMKIHGNLKAYGTGNLPVSQNNPLLEEARKLGKTI